MNCKKNKIIKSNLLNALVNNYKDKFFDPIDQYARIETERRIRKRNYVVIIIVAYVIPSYGEIENFRSTPADLSAHEPIMEQMTINEIPGTIMLNIFRYLSVYDLLLRAGLVCKSWFYWVRDRELWMTVNLSGQRNITPRGLKKVLSYSHFKLETLILPHRIHAANRSAFARVLDEECISSFLSKCKCLKILRLCRVCWRSVVNVAELQNSNRLLKMEGLRGIKDKRDICMLAATYWKLAQETGMPFWRFLEFISASNATKNKSLLRFLQSLCEKESEEKRLRESCGIPWLSLMKQEEILITKMKRCYIFETGKSLSRKHSRKVNLNPCVRASKKSRIYHQPRKGVLQRCKTACIRQ
ncbi:hypothetical protein CHS0354_035574 [Potamilus streckersoni]|uniref:F-box domain-containing protein n=1 Tax=Potamilus streckersoni TaxID=2493646 RepID=A0AAE0VIK2_9BIVA|nr:hypothetical protein CHS0354_035574 [Potamilus streckersoni]